MSRRGLNIIPVTITPFETNAVIALLHIIQALMDIGFRGIEEFKDRVGSCSNLCIRLHVPTVIIEHHIPFFIFLLERWVLQQYGDIQRFVLGSGRKVDGTLFHLAVSIVHICNVLFNHPHALE